MVALIAVISLLAVVIGGLLLSRSWRQRQQQRDRDRVRLRLIEGQMAALRAALRISVAEHNVRRAMATQGRDQFANRTDHGE